MSVLIWLVPIALAMGAAALVAFLWSLRSGQYEDLIGAAERVLLAHDDDRPIVSNDEVHSLEDQRSLRKVGTAIADKPATDLTKAKSG